MTSISPFNVFRFIYFYIEWSNTLISNINGTHFSAPIGCFGRKLCLMWSQRSILFLKEKAVKCKTGKILNDWVATFETKFCYQYSSSVEKYRELWIKQFHKYRCTFLTHMQSSSDNWGISSDNCKRADFTKLALFFLMPLKMMNLGSLEKKNNSLNNSMIVGTNFKHRTISSCYEVSVIMF